MSSERVLVVDDEQLNLFIIEEFLEQEILELETHSNPLKAWESLQAPGSDFSLVVLDRMMPGEHDLDIWEGHDKSRAAAEVARFNAAL